MFHCHFCTCHWCISGNKQFLVWHFVAFYSFLFLCDFWTLPSALPMLSFCSFTYCSHFCSFLLHLVDDSLVFEFCAFCSMICSYVSLPLPGLSLFLLLLLHPGSQQNLTYVFASDVLIYNCTMLLMVRSSLLALFVSFPWSTLTPPSIAPTCLCSIPLHAIPMAGLSGTDLLYSRWDCGLTCQPLGETLGVGLHSSDSANERV